MLTLPKGFTWSAPLNGGAPLDLDPEKDGDEWIELVFRRLGSTAGVTSYQTSGHTTSPSGLICRLSGPGHRTALWVRSPPGRDPICLVLGAGEPRANDIEMWSDAVTHALGQIGTVIVFRWWTIIGPDPFAPVVAVRLKEPTVVAGLQLDPATDLFAENVPGRFNVFQARPQKSGLVKVVGESAGYTWDVAAEDAAKRLRLLCSMLSVSCGTPWIQRSNVNPLFRTDEHGGVVPLSGEEIELPAVSPWDREEFTSLSGDVQMRSVEVPEWIGRRWEAVAGDKTLTHALLNHHEGMLMMPDHPSHAALAFVTTIEALGNRGLKKLPRCPECKVVTGSTERFRRVLARVIPGKEADELGRKFYDWRSRTAHQGVLHGSEPAFGARSIRRGISADTARDFQNEIYGLASAARRLLLGEVSGADTPPVSLR